MAVYGKRAAVWACAACSLFGLCAPAAAQFHDNFDSYPAGGGLVGLGGWELWFSGGNDGLITTERANSNPNSFRYSEATDVVQRFAINSGQWTASVMTYMPSNAGGTLDKDGYFIMLNQYQNPGENWSVQVRFSAEGGVVESQWDLNSTLLIYDRWVELRAEIDLDLDSVELFYDGVSFAPPRLWTENNFAGGPGILEIAAIDLWSDTVDGMFVDDVSLTEVGGGLCGDANCDAAFNGADIDPFFLALGNPAAWETQYGSGGLGCDIVKSCDINYDGLVNGADIDPFFVALGLGYCP